MNRTARLVVFGLGVVTPAVLLGTAVFHLPTFGGTSHPYRDGTVAAALLRRAPNVVTSINFDQRGLDTFSGGVECGATGGRVARLVNGRRDGLSQAAAGRGMRMGTGRR